jgi:gliding motility-associated-like protein
MRCYFLFIVLLFHLHAGAETTLTFQPDAACGEDAPIASFWPDNNYATHNDFIVCAWTYQSNPSTTRVLINFDLGTIPAGATVVHAELQLFHYASPSNTGHSNLSGPANAWLERVIQPWNESTVTWNNQPLTTMQNRVNVTAPFSTTQNYTITVTALVQDMLANPGASYGFMMRQQTESYYRSLLFATSDHPNAALRPKLVVTYAEDSLPSAGCWTSVLIIPNNPNPPPPAPPSPDPFVTLPNVFTPNNDGINDFFFVDSTAAEIISFCIFNRWGNLVYASQPGAPWNGDTENNLPCSDGTYYYLVEYRAGGKVIVLKGFVTLLR